MFVVSDTARLAFCFVGVVGSLLIYGVLQVRPPPEHPPLKAPPPACA
jgi:hypothetical protein